MLKKAATLAFMIFVCGICGVQSSWAADTTAPSSPVKLIFIHHSTGGNWLADENDDTPSGGLGAALMNNNYYVSATNYGWGLNSIGDRTDIPNWPEWFTGSESATILSAVYGETGQNVGDFGAWSRLSTDPGGENTIIMFKSCFPNSDLFGNPDDAAAAEPGDQFTVSNAKAVYNKLLTYFQTRRDKLFVVITAPPQNESAYSDDYQTAAQRSANARAFNNWLVNNWLSAYPYKNVAVFDYFNVLTAEDNHHRWQNDAVEHVTNTSYNYSAYPVDAGDSHPNSSGHRKATSEFVLLLNYFYNTWKAEQGNTQTSVELTGLSFGLTTPVQAGNTVTFSAQGISENSAAVYYRFNLIPNYGTENYDPNNGYQTLQNFTASGTYSHTFNDTGAYILVAFASPDTSDPKIDAPIMGACIDVGGSIQINSLSMNATKALTAGDSVTFTVEALRNGGETLYYRFDLIPNYGTAQYDPYNNYETIQNYSTVNTCTHTFNQAGNYIIVVYASPTDTHPGQGVAMIGGAIRVK